MGHRFVRLILCLMFAVPCLAQDALPDDQLVDLFQKRLALRIKAERLSEKDCEELGFVDETGGRIQVTSTGPERERSSRSFENEYEGRQYLLDFRSTAEVELKDLKIECRFFYTVENTWRVIYRKTEEELKYKDCQLSASVGAGEKVHLETDPFIMNSWAMPSGVYQSSGEPDVVECSPEGLWVRVTYSTSGGKKITRDFYEPKSLSSRMTWDGKSI